MHICTFICRTVQNNECTGIQCDRNIKLNPNKMNHVVIYHNNTIYIHIHKNKRRIYMIFFFLHIYKINVYKLNCYVQVKKKPLYGNMPLIFNILLNINAQFWPICKINLFSIYHEIICSLWSYPIEIFISKSYTLAFKNGQVLLLWPVVK